MSISDIFSQPRSVSLGGIDFRVGELRLVDLAILQGWLDSRWVDPMDAIRDRLEGMDEDERQEALWRAWAEAEEGPPAWGTDRARELCGSGAGILELFRVALGRHHPELDLEAVAGVAEGVTPQQYAAMRRVLFGVGPLDEIEGWLDAEPERGGSVPWPQAVCEVCEVFGWSIGYVGSLTLSQFRAARTGGKPVERGRSVQPKTNLRDVVADARRKFTRVRKDG